MKNPDRNTILWDLDGTLIDSAPSIGARLNEALQEAGLLPISDAQVRAFVGNSSRVLVQCALEAQPQPVQDPAIFETVLARYDQGYLAEPIAGTAPYEGVEALLEEFQAEGVFQAVFSNKPQVIAERVVAHFFAGRFATVQGFQPSIPRKPDPTGLFDLLQAHGRMPEATLYIGDSEVDAELGTRAGIRTFLVSYGFRSEAALRKGPISEIFPSVAALRTGMINWREGL